MNSLLELKGLTKSFGGFNAVSDINLTIQEGRCVALLGPNGAGKTTTIRMIAGLLKPSAGQMVFHGESKGSDPRERIGYLPQAPSFYPWMTGFEYVVYAGRLCGLTAAASRAKAKELLERVGLSGAAARRTGSYSGGMKQRLGLAQALIHQPRLLLMDEPVSALDPIGRREVLELLGELKRETTVLFSTHVLHDAEELCDDVIIIRSGQIALQGAIEQIRNDHRKPTIELQVEPDEHSRRWLTSYMEQIRSESSGDVHAAAHEHEIQLKTGIVRFTVSDVEAARQALLEELLREQVKVRRLEIGYTSLEDLFIQVVTA